MFIYKHIVNQHNIYIIFPHLLKIYQINKNGKNVALYLFVIVKNIFKIKYVIYETHNIIFNILKFYENIKMIKMSYFSQSLL